MQTEVKRSFKTGPGSDLVLSRAELQKLQDMNLMSEFYGHVGHESGRDHTYKVRTGVQAVVSFLTETAGLQYET